MPFMGRVAVALVALLVPTGVFAQAAPPQKAVLVTGASSGIGRKITERLAERGFFVYAGARSPADLADLGKLQNVQPLRLDVTVASDIAAAVAAVTKAGRGLYGVVNNAGVVGLAPLLEITDEELQLAMAWPPNSRASA
jgi:NAD(P)-dependent dehydrogenase (short-subunit alcohol dehydrogenase family)